jgi:hypothetical protein
MKNALSRMLFPNALVIIMLILICAASLTFVFVTDRTETLWGYVTYALSAYALTVLATGVPRIAAKAKAFIYDNKYGNKYMTDIPFRVKISLYWSLAINVLYAAFKLIAGIYYGSFWFGAEAIFYIILSVVRFILLAHVGKNDDDLRTAYKKYRFCGYLLFALNATLTGVVYQMINHGRGYQYPGLMIYAAAAYAFFCLTLSIVNMSKYRKLKNPIVSASMSINFARALVAIFALQTAMFASFGGDTTFVNIMNSVVGGCVCLVIFGMAVYMIVRANTNLKKLDFNNSQTYLKHSSNIQAS